MKSLTLINILLLTCVFSFSQKMPEDYFKEGVSFSKEGDQQKALAAFGYIVENHPRNTLYPKAFYNMGALYSELKQFDSAAHIFKAIIHSDFNEREALGGGIMADPYANFRHRSCSFLHRNYLKEKAYDSAFHYLALSDTAYPYLHFCGNAYSSHQIYISLKYADLYELLDKPEAAKSALFETAFVSLEDNSRVLDRLMLLLLKDYSPDVLREKLEKALKKSYKRKVRIDGENLKKTYIRYLGEEIELLGSYYLSENPSLEELAAEFRKTDFYKRVQDL